MATLIESLIGRGLDVEDYAFQARKFFCQPSKKTLVLAEKVMNRLESKFADKLEAWAEKNSSGNNIEEDPRELEFC